MKIIWTGTDSLMLLDVSRRNLKNKIRWKLFRLYIRLLEWYVQEHIAVSEGVANNLREFGIKKSIIVKRSDIRYSSPVKKLPHKKFTILYYYPRNKVEKEFKDWLYGRDIINDIKLMFPNLNYIEVNGYRDMNNIYDRVDFYIRPNRHDGHSKMIEECKINNIPYYWSTSNPDCTKIMNCIIDELNKKILDE